MRSSNKRVLSVVFFCSLGWVCNSRAIGADNSLNPPTLPPSPSATPPATQPAGFAQPDQNAKHPASPATEAAQPDADAKTSAAPTTSPAPGASLFGNPADNKTAATGPDKNEKLPDGQSVSVGSFGQIDLHVKDLELTQVLQLLSIQSQRNIVATKSVTGTVSADLYGVDFHEALDAILHTNGFGYREKGNFIYVYTVAELKTMQDAERKVTHRIIHLNYITASDAAKFITPLLSSSGSVGVNGDAAGGFQPTLTDGGAKSFANIDTLILRDYPENIDEILSVIKELDTRPKQVEVEATVLQANLEEDNSFGVDLTVLADFAMDEFTSPLTALEQIASGTGPTGAGASGAAGGTTVGQTQAGQSGLQVGIVSKNIAAFIKALDQVTDTTVLANPKALVLNRQRAELLVGNQLGYLSTTTTDTSATQTVQFLDVGTKLTLRPFVSDDNFIRLELRPSISDGSTQQVGTTVIPNTTTQELTTNVMVRSGQTVVLGGLFKENTTIARRQVPFIGDLPVVGIAFKGQDDTILRSEIIFLVTPTVLKDEALYAEGESMNQSIEMARFGAREGLLPFSRTKLTASHVRDALKYDREGKRDKALSSVNMALALEPRSIDALRLKEKLTGERVYWPQSSLIMDAADHTIRQQINAVPSTQPSAKAPAKPAAEKPVHPEVKTGVKAAPQAATAVPATQPQAQAKQPEPTAAAATAAPVQQTAQQPAAVPAARTAAVDTDTPAAVPDTAAPNASVPTTEPAQSGSGQ